MALMPKAIRDIVALLTRLADAAGRIADNTSRQAEDRLTITDTTWPMPPFLPNYAKQILRDMDWFIDQIKRNKPDEPAHLDKLKYHRNEFAQWAKIAADFDKYEKADD